MLESNLGKYIFFQMMEIRFGIFVEEVLLWYLLFFQILLDGNDFIYLLFMLNVLGSSFF